MEAVAGRRHIVEVAVDIVLVVGSWRCEGLTDSQAAVQLVLMKYRSLLV